MDEVKNLGRHRGFQEQGILLVHSRHSLSLFRLLRHTNFLAPQHPERLQYHRPAADGRMQRPVRSLIPPLTPHQHPSLFALTQLFTIPNSFGALNIHILITTLSSLPIPLLCTLAFAVFGSAFGAVIGLSPASVAHILGPRPAQ